MRNGILRLLLPVLVVLPLVLAAGGAEAHGRQVKISLSSLVPDPNSPRTRLYRASVTYQDGDPAPGLQVALSAVRSQDGMTIGPVTFAPLTQPGSYAAEVTYPVFGIWSVNLRVRGEGDGETTLTEEVLPAAPVTALAGSGKLADPRQVEVLFRFGPGDVVNIAARILHSLSAGVWFGLAALILVTRWFALSSVRDNLLRRTARVFPPGAVVSLGLLLVTGMYSALYNAPNRAPGLFAPLAVARFPFGDVYLTAFVLKVIMYLATVAITLALVVSFRRLGRGDERSEATIHRLALSNTILGILVFVDVSVLIYFHYLSHLGVLLP